MSDQSDTIFALASGSPPSGVAIIRISGIGVPAAVGALAGILPEPRVATLRTLRDHSGHDLDNALIFFFPGPRSYTGEDMAELHVHGGRAVVAAVLDALGRISGLRVAEPGEFTQRALLNGKTDLAGAEALADLINAETESQRRLALHSAATQGALFEKWRSELLEYRSLIEADLDFSDEGDVPGSVADMVWPRIASLAAEMQRFAAGYRRAEIVRGGLRVVLAGATNAGKSSLLNHLARREVAIVSPEHGTTRDVLTVDLDLYGYKVVLSDTAGFRPAPGTIEAIGIDRARAAIAAADLVLWLDDGSGQIDWVRKNVPEEKLWVIHSKADQRTKVPVDAKHSVSVVTGAGIDRLLSEISAFAESFVGSLSIPLPSQERHVVNARQAAAHLGEALQVSFPLEVRAEAVRAASLEIERLSGRVDVEDLLGSVFSRFCIGK